MMWGLDEGGWGVAGDGEHSPTLKPVGYALHLASKLLHDICLPRGFLSL